jgi:hypothetical protein
MVTHSILHSISYLYIILICLNTIVRNKDIFEIDFQIRGLFYITIFYIIIGFMSSKAFRKVILSKTGLIIIMLLLYSTVIGVNNGSDFYWIKNDYYKISLLCAGILILLLNKKRIALNNFVIISIIFFFYFSLIIYFFLNGTTIIGKKNSMYPLIQILNMGMPILIFQITKYYYLNRKNIVFYLMLLLIFILFYETFIAFTRSNILGIMLSLFILILFNKTNYTLKANLVKIIFLTTILIAVMIPFVSLLKTGFIDRTSSDNFRLREASHVFNTEIIDNIYSGEGMGSTFIGLSSNILSEAHIGLITLWLKFGLIGLITILVIIGLPFIRLIISPNLGRLNGSNKIILFVPALSFWVLSLLVSKGTYPEALFGLGLAIGSYFQFCYSINWMAPRRHSEYFNKYQNKVHLNS